MEQLTSKASKELTLLLEDRSSIQLKMGRLERNISNQETRQQNIHGRNDILQQKLDDIHRDMVAGDDIYHRLLRVSSNFDISFFFPIYSLIFN